MESNDKLISDKDGVQKTPFLNFLAILAISDPRIFTVIIITICISIAIFVHFDIYHMLTSRG